MLPHRRIILLIETNSAFGRGCLRGISRYARTHGGWTFCYDPRSIGAAIPVKTLREWKADGMIARAESDAVIDAVLQLGLPTVDLRGKVTLPNVASIGPDDRLIVEMALDHLLAKKMANLAYCGFPGVEFSDARQAVFVEHLQKRGAAFVFTRPELPERKRHHFGFSVFESADWGQLKAWLTSLPRPIGILACNDARGHQIIDACTLLGIKVPYEVSVIGVDNDEVFCELSDPTMSSVDPNVEAIGFKAAGVLDGMLGGAKAAGQPIIMPPAGIIVRGSSDSTALHDVGLAEAVRIIRSKIDSGINVKQILAEVPMSRSTLERQFHDHLGCTPYEYILRCRIDRIKDLLLHTDYPLSRVAHMAGFDRMPHMTSLFRARTGLTPSDFRASRGYAPPKH